MTNERHRDNPTSAGQHQERAHSDWATLREVSTAATLEAKLAMQHPVSGMNPSEAQPESNPAPTYFDPEAPVISEQEFSARLQGIVDRPTFVVDAPEDCKTVQQQSTMAEHSPQQLNSSAHGDTDAKGAAQGQGWSESQPNADWRDQISEKVSKYKSRSRHQPRYPSLQLRFEESRYAIRPRRDDTVNPAPTFSQSVAAEIVAMQPTLAVATEPRICLETAARVLEFPRLAPPHADPNELAEPMIDRPRIVEAPELLPPPPAMGGILIEAPQEPEPERRPGFDMPLQSASLSRRLWAASIDVLLLAIAVATFGYVFVRITGALPRWQTVAEFGAALLALLWPAYQYAFQVLSETTPGLYLADLQIQRFDGTPAPRSLRRWRVLASVLSAVSLGLGYAWCFLDEDQLSWHDRITRTHLAPVNRG
jgi:hypothetical protein